MCRKSLRKFLIGRVSRQEPLMAYEGALDEPFYAEVKENVAAYFKQNNLHPRFSWSMYFKAAFLITGMFTTFGLAHYAAPSVGLSLLSAGACGVFMAVIGTAIQHDANHGAFHPSPAVNFVMGMSLDLIGMSSHNWKQQHVANHHVYTNVHDKDPDINIEYLMRLSVFQPLKNFHWAQWVYATMLYGFMMVKIKYYDDFSKYFT